MNHDRERCCLKPGLKRDYTKVRGSEGSSTQERWLLVFEKKKLNKLLELEYNDILQWDFSDSFYILTLKQILLLEWMERNCPHVRFLLNGNDDVFANTDNMVEYLQSQRDNDGSKHLFTSHLFQDVGPIRWPGSKCFIPVPVQESDSYPPRTVVVGDSSCLAAQLWSYAKCPSQSPFFPIHDVYMGMCLAKAGLSPDSHIGVKTAGMYIPSKLDKYDPCYYKVVLLVDRFLSAHIYLEKNT